MLCIKQKRETKMRWTPFITVAAVIEQQGRFLMVEERVNGRLVFNQPAGHLEQHETLIDAVIREVFEETAHYIEPQALIGAYQYTYPESLKTYLRFCFTGKVISVNLHHPLDKGIVQTLWLSREELALQANKLRSPFVLKNIDDYLKGIRYPLDFVQDLE